MDDAIAAKLIALNKEFYQTFAGQFSATRQRLQPGVQRILGSIDPQASILDLGCGNGELARILAQRGQRGFYLGLDFSRELLEVARVKVAEHPNFHFVRANLAEPEWQFSMLNDQSSVASGKREAGSGDRSAICHHSEAHIRRSAFTIILAFATLHHLPGKETHLQILRTVRNLLTSEGRFIHSNWRFLNSQRLRARIQPWSVIGISANDVDPGDYLLDWRRGGIGYRYVHHFSVAELASLADETGFEIVESFHSDGETGDLGLYQIWKKSRG